MDAINFVCEKCKHFRALSGGCDAFPNEIPDEIVSGENKHSKPLPKQKNKIVFEKYASETEQLK